MNFLKLIWIFLFWFWFYLILFWFNFTDASTFFLLNLHLNSSRNHWCLSKINNQIWLDFSTLKKSFLRNFDFILTYFWLNLTSISTFSLIFWFIWDFYWFRRTIKEWSETKIYWLLQQSIEEFLSMLIEWASCFIESYWFSSFYFDLSH